MLKVFKNKILLTYFSLVFLSFALLNYILVKHFEKETLSRNIEKAELYLKTLEADIEAKKAAPQALKKLADDYFSRFGVRLTFIAASGQVVADSQVPCEKITDMDNHLGRAEIAAAAENGTGFSLRYSTTLGKEMIYYAEKKQIGEKNMFLRAALPMQQVNAQLLSSRKKISAYFLFFLFISSIAAWLALKKSFYPLEKIVYASKRYASGDFSHRILPEGASGELKKLSQTLNYMADSIQSQMHELESKNRQLSVIFENMQEAVALIDEHKLLKQYNQKFAEIFAGNASNKDIETALKSGEALEAIDIAWKTGVKTESDFLYSQDGRNYRICAIPLAENSSDAAIVAVIYDTDEHKRLEDMKKDFIGNLSHEIKTPVTVIKTAIETVLSDPSMKKQDLDNFLNAIDKNAARIENIARDIISLNYLESNIRLNREKINLFSFIQAIQDCFKAYIHESAITFHNDAARDFFINADKDIIEKAFFNLFDNAVKFNIDKGFIRVSAVKEKNSCLIIFENSGPLIPKESLERIFERFYTADKSRSRLKGGTGLGLSIAKHAVELHGGNIKAESAGGINKFTVNLPS